jgi:TonB family protein
MPPPQQNRRRSRRGLFHWIALAVLIHLEMALVVGLVAYFWVPRNAELAAGMGKEGPESIDVNTLDDETSRKILAELEKEQEKAEEEKKKKEEESVEAPGQVVDLAKPQEEKRPDKARFAAEYDSSVAKESRKYGVFDKKSQAGDARGEAEQSRAATPPTPPSPTRQPTPPGAMAMRSPGPQGRPGPQGAPGEAAQTVAAGRPGEAFEAPAEADGELSPQGNAQILRVPAGARAGGSPAPGNPGGPPPALTPSDQQVARAISSGTQDHLKDIDEGDETALNAKKWKFASFFNRVKQQVRDHWRPAEEYRRRDPTGAIYGQKDRYTLLRVQLKPDGTLANVALEMPSGIEFLDDEAIEAFKQAQPFPNPPKQLVDNASGLINFRFGFFFELSGSPRMKIFRYGSM